MTVTWAAHPITMDGLFSDWSEVSIAASDPRGDNIIEDFAELRITNDNDFLFLNLSFHNGEYLIQDWNEMRLYIDTDNNTETGLGIREIGAELEWCFGCRQGIFHSPTSSYSIFQNDIRLRLSPTVTSIQFELSISRTSSVMTLNGTQTADTIRIIFVETNLDGDVLPDDLGGIQFVIDTTYIATPEPISLERIEDDHFRVLTYNIWANGFFDLERKARFQRILSALDSDVMSFQEAWGDSIEIAELFAEWMPQSTWHVSPEYHGNYVVSKYPIVDEAVLIESERSMAILLDTESILGKDLLIINSHFSCCRSDESRQHEVDELISVLREWRSGNGPFELPGDTPIIHLGDFNLVGYRQQLDTLTEGDIVDEDTFGEDFAPDWDGTPITNLFSRHTAIRMGYTWRQDWSSFSPGKLDYILYTDSVLDIGKHFVLNTTAMSDADLATYGLELDDTNIASDHLPRVIDITGVHTAEIGEERWEGIPNRFELFPAYPNPFNATTTIQFSILESEFVSLKVFNILGNEISTLIYDDLPIGQHHVNWNGDSQSSGIYFIRMESGSFVQTKKVLLLK